MYSRMKMTDYTGTYLQNIEALKRALSEADAVVVGAGAGLSAAAGFLYSGERFAAYFSDFAAQYGFSEMYSGGFYHYPEKEEFWAYWSRNIWINRYMNAPKPVYEMLLSCVKDKDYFVLTTNVDHCFQKAGFEKSRLFYTQGDYGLFQCSEPCHARTYDNAQTVREMVTAQGFTIGTDGELLWPEAGLPRMSVPAALHPVCPVCGKPMVMNLRTDDKFVEDDGWHAAAARYTAFLRSHTGKLLLLELGVGGNTPGIIKFPFWEMTAQRADATYACINRGEAHTPEVLRERSICIDADIAAVLEDLLES